MSSDNRRLVLVITGTILLCAAVSCVSLFWLFGPDRKLQRDARMLGGLSEATVVAKMGAPRKIVTVTEIAKQPNAPWWNPEGGWQPVPSRPVSNRVLLYFGVWSGAFVYISPTGVVEYVHTVGT